MLAEAAVVGHATVRATRNHLLVVLGGRHIAAGLAFVALATLVVVNLSVFAFWNQITGLTSQSLDAETRRLITVLLVEATVLTAVAVSMSFAVLLPNRSTIGIAAGIAGASRRGVELGQSLPGLLLCTVLGIGVQIGAIVSLGRQSGSAVSGVAGLLLLSLVAALAALLLVNLGQTVGRLLRWGWRASLMTGLVSASLGLGALAIDLLAHALDRQLPLVGRFLLWLWRGDPVPESPWALTTLVVAAPALVALYLGLATLGTRSSFMTGDWRLGSPAVWSSPRAFPVQQGLRDVWLWARHPMTQIGATLLTGVAALLAVGVHTRAVEPGLAALLLAVLASGSPETASGRYRPWLWVLLSSGYPAWRYTAVRLAALWLVSYAGVVGLLLAVVPHQLWSQMLLAVTPLFLGMFSIAALAGALIPYSDSSPVTMFVTSLLTLLLDGLLIYLEVGRLALDTASSFAFNGAVALSALGAATLLESRARMA